MSTDPRVPAAFRSATEDDPYAASSDHPAAARPAPDPLRLCVNTTVALIAWLVTPALAVAVFGTIAIVGYAKARRAGLLHSRCRLGDTRLVLAYLTLATAAGIAWTLRSLLG